MMALNMCLDLYLAAKSEIIKNIMDKYKYIFIKSNSPKIDEKY